MRLLTLGLIFFVSSFIGLGQDDQFTIHLRNGDFIPQTNVNKFIANPSYSMEELVNGNYFRMLQFVKTPLKKDKEELAAAGIKLYGYLSEKTYYTALSQNANLSLLNLKSVRSVITFNKKISLSEALYSKEYPEWALKNGDRIELTALHFENILEPFAVAALEEMGAEITMKSGAGIISFICLLDEVDNFYSIPGFYFFEAVAAPDQLEDYKDVSNHRSNYINNPIGVGKSYSGNGVTVMMQDDGTIGPHIDYQGRLTTEVSSNNGDHGDHVAGILMGAGNLNPDIIGNAPGTHLLVYNSQNNNYNFVPDLYLNDDLVITSKSYGNGNNVGYTILSSQLDEQCNNFDALVHVFSAGNSGASNFGYGAGAGWGNITGGHKQGKNVLAVGNLTTTDYLSSSSSRGPASDGRIKPNICAVGSSVNSTIDPNTFDVKSGTSMACPGVAGSLALLYEAYRDLNNGQNPSAALINAAVMNTAEDLGNPGPDFKYGWGRINVRRAYQILEEANYQFSSIIDGQTNSHVIDVPDGTKQVRVMLYWTDYQASPAANIALVNDINMTVTSPSVTVFQPWVLNPLPIASVLDMDAEPGVDNLNNMEQVTIDDPASGEYTLNISGFDIPEGPQDYVLVYEFIKDEIIITFPIGGESVKAGSQELIMWDAIGEDGTFLIESTLDGGLTWEQVSITVLGTKRSRSWFVPSSAVSGKAKIRITRGSEVAESKTYFSIIGQPVNLNVEWACPQSFNFSWDSIPGAIGYEVFLLGDKYMDLAGYTEGTNATVYANSLEPQWYSVRAIGPDNCIGKRAIAAYKDPFLAGCTLNPPIANFTSVCNEIGKGSCVQFSDISENAGQGSAWEWTFPGGTPATSNLENPFICYATEGSYDVLLTVKNGVGEDQFTWSEYVQIVNGNPLPFSEEFELDELLMSWKIENENSQSDWRIDNNVSAYNIGSHAIVFDNLSNSVVGATASFISQQLDLTSIESIMELSFDVAYANRLNANDSLRVYISNNCGVSKQLLYASGGDQLATADETSGTFVPLSSEWRFEAISLAEFNNWNSATFIFENYSANGNSLYIDNINLRVSEDNFSSDLISVFPNPFLDEVSIAGLVEGEKTTIRIHGLRGELVYENSFEVLGGTIVIATDYFTDGFYVIEITSASTTHKMKLIKALD
jgi:PKD repeat protein